jgi:hypothetical protein
MKRPQGPWSELFGNKEDQRLLASLKAQKWQPDACYSFLKELLSPLVQSLHFNSHSRWGLQIESQEIRTLCLKFLGWMNQKNEWPAIEARLSAKAPSSLLVCLSRSFVRFQAQTGIKKQLEREPSYSAKRTLLELPHSQTLSQIGGAVLDAFTSLTAQLPDDLRLPYQLHLEGLINPEISALLGIDESDVSTRINDAKNYLKGPATWKRAS